MVIVILQLAVLLPSDVVAVIIAVPAPTPVTTPLELTVVKVLSEDVHVTVLFVALSGAIVAVKISVPPTDKVSVVLFKFIDVG